MGPTNKYHPWQINDAQPRALRAHAWCPCDYLGSLRLWSDRAANCARAARNELFSSAYRSHKSPNRLLGRETKEFLKILRWPNPILALPAPPKRKRPARRPEPYRNIRTNERHRGVTSATPDASSRHESWHATPRTGINIFLCTLPLAKIRKTVSLG